MKNGILIGKLQSLDETLNELRSLGKVTTAQLSADWRTRRAVERDLQIAVEVVIDVCQRIIALHQQTPAATSAQAVERCVQLGVLSGKTAYEKMVQFRNFVVHRYERIDVDILADIVNNRLGDFVTFRNEVMRFYQHDRRD
jgi:uncharacterized protein YutE (UPF0331/DUF86 family)